MSLTSGCFTISGAALSENDIRDLLSGGAMTRDQMCSALGVSNANLSMPLANLARAGVVSMDKSKDPPLYFLA